MLPSFSDVPVTGCIMTTRHWIAAALLALAAGCGGTQTVPASTTICDIAVDITRGNEMHTQARVLASDAHICDIIVHPTSGMVRELRASDEPSPRPGTFALRLVPTDGGDTELLLLAPGERGYAVLNTSSGVFELSAVSSAP